MELSEVVNILIQSTELAQKGGVLTLDDAFVAKQAIDVCKDTKSIKIGKGVKTALNVLVKIAEIGQRKGIYTLKDAYFIFLATDFVNNIDDTTNKKGE